MSAGAIFFGPFTINLINSCDFSYTIAQMEAGAVLGWESKELTVTNTKFAWSQATIGSVVFVKGYIFHDQPLPAYDIVMTSVSMSDAHGFESGAISQAPLTTLQLSTCIFSRSYAQGPQGAMEAWPVFYVASRIFSQHALQVFYQLRVRSPLFQMSKLQMSQLPARGVLSMQINH